MKPTNLERMFAVIKNDPELFHIIYACGWKNVRRIVYDKAQQTYYQRIRSKRDAKIPM